MEKIIMPKVLVLLERRDNMQQCKFQAAEIKKLLKNMVILVDSREKNNKHILDYFTKNYINYRIEKLDYGDYSFMFPVTATGTNIYFHREICIERKANLEELSNNLAQGRERFESEFLRAGNNGCKVYLMVEDTKGYTGIIEHQYSTKLRPTAYMASLKAFEARFNTNVQFINKDYAGYYIYVTFCYFAREALK